MCKLTGLPSSTALFNICRGSECSDWVGSISETQLEQLKVAIEIKTFLLNLVSDFFDSRIERIILFDVNGSLLYLFFNFKLHLVFFQLSFIIFEVSFVISEIIRSFDLWVHQLPLQLCLYLPLFHLYSEIIILNHIISSLSKSQSYSIIFNPHSIIFRNNQLQSFLHVLL